MYLIFLLSCSYENKTLKEEFEFEDANLHLDTTIVNTIKAYIKEAPSLDIITLHCQSMLGRNNIVLLRASKFGHFLYYRAMPSAYFKIDDTPILLYYGKLKLDIRQDSLRYTEFIKVHTKKFSNEISLYDPPCWILELSKGSILVYKRVQEYNEKVGFYQPTVEIW
jgi:hypothetical protein